MSNINFWICISYLKVLNLTIVCENISYIYIYISRHLFHFIVNRKSIYTVVSFHALDGILQFAATDIGTLVKSMHDFTSG